MASRYALCSREERNGFVGVLKAHKGALEVVDFSANELEDALCAVVLDAIHNSRCVVAAGASLSLSVSLCVCVCAFFRFL